MGVTTGLGLGWWNGTLSTGSDTLMGIAGLIAIASVLYALLSMTRKRLGVADLYPFVTVATVIGLVSGVIALTVAPTVTDWIGTLTHAETGEVDESQLFFAGFVEETSKMLLPLILLIVGMKPLRDPRLGAWAVAVSGALFGLIEGILYTSGQEGGTEGRAPASDAWLPEGLRLPIEDSYGIFERIIAEMGHVLWTVPAAGIIWVAARSARPLWQRIGIGALGWLGAVSFHSFNDAMLSPLPEPWDSITCVSLMVVGGVFWYRLVLRRMVPPSRLDDVPAWWLPPLPPHRPEH